jgi:hypothetical protein
VIVAVSVSPTSGVVALTSTQLRVSALGVRVVVVEVVDHTTVVPEGGVATTLGGVEES